jgi:hypothetical protein
MNFTKTIKESLFLFDELAILLQKSMPLRAKYNLNKLYEVLSLEKKKFEEFRKAYFDNKDFSYLDEDGIKKHIKAEKVEDFLKEIEEYLLIEIEFNFLNEFDLFSQVNLFENENFPTFFKLFE